MGNNIVVDTGALRNILYEELNDVAESIKKNHRSAGQIASGRTYKSIRAEVTSAGGGVATGVVWGRFPFGTLETGRKAGKIPYGFTAIIEEWMANKGIKAQRVGKQTQEQADRSLAYCIGRKIARSGTKLHRTGGRSDIYSNVIPDALERISQRIGVVFADTAETITLNN